MNLPAFYEKEPAPVSKAESKYLDSLAALLSKTSKKTELFSFEPNNISLDSLLLLGFQEAVAQRLVKYRSKGGVFKTKGDIGKIYGLDSAFMDELFPYIQLPDAISAKANKNYVDINRATKDDLIQSVGLNSAMAGRIIGYRHVLGGFVELDQLSEVYDLSDDFIKQVKRQTYIAQDFEPGKIQVNQASLEDLRAHPYISYNLAEDIIRFREINSSIESEKVLYNFKSVDKSNFETLILYLDFQK